MDDIKKILNPDFIKQLELISICGVYGDPICNKDLKSILNYLYECNCNIDIDVYTNGDLYDNDWWENLAITHKNHNFTVIFGIDGIGEIHSLHRCNTNYDKIISHAISFINNGGKAKWDYIVFKHNEHQVEEAREISKKLGFQEFQIKKTSRFLKNIYESDAALDSTISEYGKHPVFDNKGNIDYYIELPNKSIYRNESEKKASELKEKYGTFLEYLNKVEIICDAIKTGGVFISAGGELFPCCSVYQQVCYKTIHNVLDPEELNEYNLYINSKSLSCFDASIKDIVEGDFFKNLLLNFRCDSIKNGKPKCCSRTCGKGLDAHKNGHTTDIKYEVK